MITLIVFCVSMTTPFTVYYCVNYYQNGRNENNTTMKCQDFETIYCKDAQVENLCLF